MRQFEMPVLNGFGRTGHLVVSGSQQDESAVGDGLRGVRGVPTLLSDALFMFESSATYQVTLCF